MTLLWEPIWRIMYGGVPSVEEDEEEEKREIGTGTLAIHVQLEDGSAIAGAALEVQDLSRQAVDVGTTDAEGNWSKQLLALQYYVVAKTIGQQQTQGVVLFKDRTTSHTFIFILPPGNGNGGQPPRPLDLDGLRKRGVF